MLKCSICNGTGLVCDVCGEPAAVCECDMEEGPTLNDCENCSGTGDYGTGGETCSQ
jgi:hypothetical protein